MASDRYRMFRSRLFRFLRYFVPKGSPIDAIFDSYDDWRDEPAAPKPSR
jgi:hypothetical protein